MKTTSMSRRVFGSGRAREAGGHVCFAFVPGTCSFGQVLPPVRNSGALSVVIV